MSRADTVALPERCPTSWIVPAILTATLLPFLWKAVSYALLGSNLPLATFAALALIVGVGLRVGGSWRRRALRVWSAAAILWGAARLVLLVSFVAADLSEAHLRSQVNLMSILLSVAYVVAGVMLWRRV